LALIHKQILNHFKAESWRNVGYNPHGVAEFEVLKDNKPVGRGTLLQLGNEARSGK